MGNFTELVPQLQSPVVLSIEIPEGQGRQLYPSLLTALLINFNYNIKLN